MSDEKTRVDINTLAPQERVNFILEIQRRVREEGRESVTDDEIRDAVRLIRLTRADGAKKKTAAATVTLADF